MNREEKRQEHHRVEREEKQGQERQSEKQFSKPGVTVRPLWFLVVGFVLTLAAVLFWIQF
jgi:cytoskeletal protein RodZ